MQVEMVLVRKVFVTFLVVQLVLSRDHQRNGIIFLIIL